MDEKRHLTSATDDVTHSSYQSIQNGSDCSTESAADGAHQGEIKVYKRRWWIIAVFAAVSLTQGYTWNTFGPLNYALMVVYDWSASVVGLYYGMCSTGATLFIIPTIYLAETRGLRFAMLMCICILMVTVSLWLLALSIPNHILVWLGGFILGGTNGIFMAAPPLVSVLWFPVQERTTATSIGTAASFIGGSLNFLAGPIISQTQGVTEDDVNNRTFIPTDVVERYRQGIFRVGYVDAGLVFCMFILTLIYFPARPPKPPSHATQVKRIDFLSGLKAIRGNKHFWLMFVAFNVSNAPYNSFLPLISVSLKSLDISEDVGGWLGFFSVVGSFTSIILSRFVDFFKRKAKLVLLVMNILQIGVFTIMLCILLKYIHFNKSTTIILLYILCISMGIIINGVTPLYYEMACELAFPVQEGLATALMVIGNNLFGVMFFVLFLVPQLSKNTVWVTWLSLISSVISLFVLLLVRQRFTRLELEEENNSNSSSDSQNSASTSTAKSA